MFLADTNIDIAAANDATFREAFREFLARRGPLAVSAVAALRGAEPLLAPSGEDWVAAAAALAHLRAAPFPD